MSYIQLLVRNVRSREQGKQLTSRKWKIIDLASTTKNISFNIDKQFIEEINHSVEDFGAQIIVQLENVPRIKN